MKLKVEVEIILLNYCTKQYKMATSSTSEETDAFSFRKQKPPLGQMAGKDIVVDAIGIRDYKPVIPAQNDDYYNMQHKCRGIALIFNHYKFDKPNYLPRKGTDRDCSRINDTLQALHFKTVVHNDLKYGSLREAIKKTATMDHRDNDCLVIFVMTHGDPDILHARDEAYYVNDLWEPFTADKCPTLAGKPKLFFIQACRGNNTDSGIEIQFDSMVERNNSIQVKIPKMADFLIMYPTPMGNYSFRSPNNGSWFIQALCDELKERTPYQDLLTILTFVNRRLAFGYSSNVPTNHDLHNKKQVGQVVHSLTRLVYFFKGIPQN